MFFSFPSTVLLPSLSDFFVTCFSALFPCFLTFYFFIIAFLLGSMREILSFFHE